MTHPEILAEELADTLAAARARCRQPPRRDPVAALARDLVGQPAPPTLGVCCYCGAVAPQATVCEAHTDLIALDDATCAVVTRNTTAACSQTSGRGTRGQAAEGA